MPRKPDACTHVIIPTAGANEINDSHHLQRRRSFSFGWKLNEYRGEPRLANHCTAGWGNNKPPLIFLTSRGGGVGGGGYLSPSLFFCPLIITVLRSNVPPVRRGIIKSTCSTTPPSLLSLWRPDEEHSEECNWRHPFVTLATVPWLRQGWAGVAPPGGK